MVDALAITGDEGRGSLRKVSGSWQTSFDPGMSEWGNLRTGRVRAYIPWGIYEREPCEVKHLSSMWKINQLRRKAQRDSVSSGERKRKHIDYYSLLSIVLSGE